jgi:hypothetical protein
METQNSFLVLVNNALPPQLKDLPITDLQVQQLTIQFQGQGRHQLFGSTLGDEIACP